MRSFPNVVRPDLGFCIPWLIVLCAYLPLTTPLNPAFNTDVALMLAFNLLSAPLILQWVESRVRRRLGAPVQKVRIDQNSVRLLHRFLLAALCIWGVSFAASILYSGGLPLIWSVTGSTKTYSDFGIPTVGGFVIMLRSFAASLSIFLFVATRRWIYIFFWLMLFLFCVTEVSRSAVFMLTCQGMAAFLLFQRVSRRHLFLTAVAGIFLVAAFVILGSLRDIQMSAADFQIEGFGALPTSVYWIWTYIVSPLGNVNHAANLQIQPLYWPANTLGAIVPSVIGGPLGLRATEYPIPLITPSLNATTMYAPLLADFGILGATLVMTLFQTFASYAYALARRGDLLYAIFYPALFGCLVLSIFYNYIGSLQILLIPAMVIWMRRFFQRQGYAALPAGVQIASNGAEGAR